MAVDKYHAIGDEVTVTGVVVAVGSNGGHPTYEIAVRDEDNERPISIPPRVHKPKAKEEKKEEAKSEPVKEEEKPEPAKAVRAPAKVVPTKAVTVKK